MRRFTSLAAIGLILGCWNVGAWAQPTLTDSIQVGGPSSPKIANPGSAFKSSLRDETVQPNNTDSRSVKAEGPNFKSSIKIEGPSK